MITFDEDVLDGARALTGKRSTSFRAIISQALRAGLEQMAQPTEQERYRTKPHVMAIRKGYNLDNIQDTLAEAEGEDFHGCELRSTDADFSRFPGLKWQNPLAD